MSDAPAIQIEGLRKVFRPARGLRTLFRRRAEVVALDGVDLEVRSGELVALVGPNGAGKTTLLQVVADLVEPDAGRVCCLGDEDGRRGRVGYVLADERSFWFRLSVADNLRFFAALEGLRGGLAAERTAQLAALLGLEELLERRFAELSSGQKQRVGIARGLLPDPPVLLFDEATRALDPGRARGLRRLVREVLVERLNKAVLFATHQLEEAEALSDRTALLVGGRRVAEGPFSEVRAEVEAAFAREAEAEDAALSRVLSGENA